MKNLLTLLVAMVFAAIVNAQTATPQNTPAGQSADSTQKEPLKETSYTVIPAQRVVTPTTQTKTTQQNKTYNISEIKQQQDQQKQETPVNRPSSAEKKQKEAEMKKQVIGQEKESPH